MNRGKKGDFKRRVSQNGRQSGKQSLNLRDAIIYQGAEEVDAVIENMCRWIYIGQYDSRHYLNIRCPDLYPDDVLPVIHQGRQTGYPVQNIGNPGR